MGTTPTCADCGRRHRTEACPVCEYCAISWQPVNAGGFNGRWWVCPRCGMDAGEHAARRRVMELGGAEVYRQEWRREHGLAE